MNESTKPNMPSRFSLITTLGGISLLSGLFVVLTYQLTRPRITKLKLAALEQSVFKVLPGAVTKTNHRLDEKGYQHLAGEDVAAANIFAGYDNTGRFIGLAMEAAAKGYQDVVHILYGYAPDTQCIIGFIVLQSAETPGLGDQVERDPAFLANFDCLEAKLKADGSGLFHPIHTVKHGQKTERWQVEGISGATVTSVAIGNALRESAQKMIPLIERYKESIAPRKEQP